MDFSNMTVSEYAKFRFENKAEPSSELDNSREIEGKNSNELTWSLMELCLHGSRENIERTVENRLDGEVFFYEEEDFDGKNKDTMSLAYEKEGDYIIELNLNEVEDYFEQ